MCAALQAWLSRLERLQLAGNGALAETLAPLFGVALTSVPSVRLDCYLGGRLCQLAGKSQLDL